MGESSMETLYCLRDCVPNEFLTTIDVYALLHDIYCFPLAYQKHKKWESKSLTCTVFLTKKLQQEIAL